jgi:hypothetical protein
MAYLLIRARPLPDDLSNQFCLIYSCEPIFQWTPRAIKRAVVLWPPQRRGGLDTAIDMAKSE